MLEDAGPAPTPFAPGSPGALVAYRGATVFDGRTAGPRLLVVDGARLRAVVDGSAPAPDGAEVVDLTGRFVVPGLIDTHQHLATPPNRPVAELALRRQLYAGVTAVRDMADDLRQIADLARATLVGEIAGPDIRYAALMAGPSFFDDPRTVEVTQGATPGDVPWMQAVTHDTDLPLAVALARGTGACAIKIYADLPTDLVAAIAAEAHRQGLAVWAHAAVFPAMPSDVVAAGVDVTSHVTMLGYETQGGSVTYRDKRPVDPAAVDPDDPRIAAVLDAMRERGTILDATAGMWTRRELATSAATAELAAALVARAHRAGVAICTGTDFETDEDQPFPALHDELFFLAERGGLSPVDVLRAATAVAARAAGADDMGTLDAGKLANFVVLDEDPLPELRHLRTVRCVVKRGRRFPRTDFAGPA